MTTYGFTGLNRIKTELPGSVLGVCLLVIALWVPVPATAQSYDGNTWYQVELSIFTNEFSGGSDGELFSPQQLDLSFPPRLRRLESYADLLALTPEDTVNAAVVDAVVEPEPTLAPDPRQQQLLDTGPEPRVNPLQFLLPDVERTAFLQLPASLSDFQQTNRALERSSENRLMFHGLWRQPVMLRGQAQSIFVQGGRRFGDRYELEGSITIRFNNSRDRVVLDTNVWLTEFTTTADPEGQWQLPDIPARLANPADTDGATYFVNRIVQIRHSREMRSNEFHYVDHPLLGVVVSVKPYTLPPPVPRIP